MKINQHILYSTYYSHGSVSRLLRNVNSQGRMSSQTSDPRKSHVSGEGTVKSEADIVQLARYHLMKHVLEELAFVLMYLHVLK
jgi:hypothetical protein